MEIISSLNLKKNNNRFLMKQEQLKFALTKLFHSKKIKWQIYSNEIYTPFINISKISLSKDYSSAKIFVSLYKFIYEEPVLPLRIEEIVSLLNQEAGLIRKYLGKELALRKTPNLLFKIDTKDEEINKVIEILDKLKYTTPSNEK